MERLESALGLASDHATKLTDLVRQVNLYDKSLPPSERAFLQKCLADKGTYVSLRLVAVPQPFPFEFRASC